MRITQTAARATKTTHLIALYFVVLMLPIFLTIFFNVDRADQLDCRRWRDNIKKAVRELSKIEQEAKKKQQTRKAKKMTTQRNYS